MTWGSETSPYEILEVSPSATREEIDVSYRRIIGFLEPDALATYAMLDESEVAQVRAQVDRAYHTLCEPEKRAAVDSAWREHEARQLAAPSTPMPLAPRGRAGLSACGTPRCAAQRTVGAAAIAGIPRGAVSARRR